MPPPKPDAEFPEMVELEMVSEVPWLKMPPPPVAEFPVIVEAEIKREPKLLKPPPKPEELFAPDTVTPEMVKLPPVLMVKILKLPWLPLMVSAEAPRPLMVRVPAVLTFKIVGRAAARVIVYGLVPVKLKLMSSLPGVLLARVIAASRDPVPEAAVVVT